MAQENSDQVAQYASADAAQAWAELQQQANQPITMPPLNPDDLSFPTLDLGDDGETGDAAASMIEVNDAGSATQSDDVPVPTPRPFSSSDYADAQAGGFSPAEIVAHIQNGDTYNASNATWYDPQGIESVIVLGQRPEQAVPINVIMHYYDTQHGSSYVSGSNEAYHAYLEIQSGSNHYYISGGPAIRSNQISNPYPYYALVGARSLTNGLVNLDSLDPAAGNLDAWANSNEEQMQFAGYAGGQPVPGDTAVQLGTVTMKWSDAVGVLYNEANAVNSSNIPYDFLNENSNSIAFSAARAFGFQPQQTLWYPGSGTPVPMHP